MLAGPLSVVALISGWITTEVGRQPWIVYEVMRVDAAVTDLRLVGIAFDARTLRVIAEADGTVKVAVSSIAF